MAIHQLNHAVLYVREIERSVEFYADVLGFDPVTVFPNAAFMRAPSSTNDHDLGLFAIGSKAGPSAAGESSVGLYHLAWEVDTLGELAHVRTVLAERGSLVGASNHGTTKSLYALDPDGLEFEVVWLIPARLLTDDDRAAALSVTPLDLDAELDRFGPDEKSGIGVSRAEAAHSPS
jgi:catechol-2,3-dioxygenase